MKNNGKMCDVCGLVCKIKVLNSHVLVVTGCNPNDLDIWTDWCRLGLQFVVYKSAEQEWSFINYFL